MAERSAGVRAAIHLLVAVGGVAALSWEVLWQLESSLALGISARGAAITLSATMAGMTAGSLFAGRRLHRRARLPPIRLYGLLEATIGVAGLFMLAGFDRLGLLDAAVYATSPALAPSLHALGIVALLGVPTFAMGATIPVFARVARSHATSVAALYGMNTLGAATGVLLIAFALIPLLGVQQTCLTVAALNLAVFLGTRWVPAETRAPQPAEAEIETAGASRVAMPVAGLVVFVTGFVTFGLEVSWFRSLRAAFESVTDSFAIMLAAVLIPLGVGARLVPRLRRTTVRPAQLLALAGVLILVATPLVERMDVFDRDGASYAMILARRFALSLAILGPSMLLLGGVLPWLLAEFGDARRCGWLYAINTAGAVLGSLLAAWVLLPNLGFARSAWLLGAAVCALAVALQPGRIRFAATAAGAAALAVAVGFTSSLGRDRVPGVFAGEGVRILAFDEGPDSTVSVVSGPDGERVLVIDGFVATSENLEGEDYMELMGRLPMLLHPDPRQSLVICFGTGRTANAVREEEPEALDIAELNRAVLEMAPYFASNRGVLEDARVRSIAMDGRAWLRRSDRRYDVVTLEPMPPHFASVNALYSKEFYEIVAEKLAPGGVVAQWLPLQLLPPFHAASAAATFLSVFPDAILWIQPNDSSGILLGRAAGADAPLGQAWPGLARSIETHHWKQEQLAVGVALDAAGLARYASLGALVTDDSQLLAYGSVADLVAHGPSVSLTNLRLIGQIARGIVPEQVPGPAHGPTATLSEGEALELMERLRVWSPRQVSVYAMLAVLYQREGRLEDARAAIRQGLEIRPDLTTRRAMRLVGGLAEVLPKEGLAEIPTLLRRAGLP